MNPPLIQGLVLRGWQKAATAFATGFLVMLMGPVAISAAQGQPVQIGSRSMKAEVRGAVEALPPSGYVGRWVISGRVVEVNANTRLKFKHGAPQIGSLVDAEGSFATDGSLIASKLSTKRYKFGEIVLPGGPGGSSAPSPAPGSGMMTVEIKGAVEWIPETGWAGLWRAGGVTFLVDAGTWLDAKAGNPVLGGWIEVKAIASATPADPPRAIKIKTESRGASESFDQFKWQGKVSSISPGTTPATEVWTIGGQAVLVDASTQIKSKHGRVTIGDHVEVKARQSPDGQLIAIKIEYKGR
ncbi:MAG: DUF5666 domain-containing protein [Casimicrobiaceae bacterium]